MFTKKPICNAPFANLYIDGNGNVTPCCFNRDDVFGNIYHHSIEEIWNSVNAIKLRKSLSKKEFPKLHYL
jgi:radical SAM protein with 4Fe4S-binding SPASM domain